MIIKKPEWIMWLNKVKKKQKIPFLTKCQFLLKKEKDYTF